MRSENLERLLDLIEKNPELPVIPFVDSDVVCEDGCGRWMGSIGYAQVTEYCVVDERYYFKEDIEDLIDHLLSHWGFEGYDEEQAKADAEKMNWQKAICAYIELPEV